MNEIIRPMKQTIDDLRERVKKLEDASRPKGPASGTKKQPLSKAPTEESPTIKVPWNKKER